MINEVGVEVAELRETANLLLRRRYIGQFATASSSLVDTEILPSDKCSPSTPSHKYRISISLQTQLQAALLKTLKHKTQMLEVLLECATLDIYVIDVDRNELV
jgi:hypothetical protein